MWDIHLLDIGLLHQLLLAGENILEEVLVDQRLGRQIELETGERYTDESLRRW